MTRRRAWAVALLLAAPALWGAQKAEVQITTVGLLPATCEPGQPFIVTDGNSSSDCVTGTGAVKVLCACDASGNSYTATGDGGGGSGAFSDASDPVVLNTITKDTHMGDGAGVLTGKVEIGGDADQPQLVVEGFSTQTDDIFIVQNDADAELFSVTPTGTVTVARQANPCITFGDSNGTDPDDNGQVCLDLTATGTGAEDGDITASVQVAGVMTDRLLIDADGDVEILGGNLTVDDGSSLKLREPTGAGTSGIILTPPATMASDRTCQLVDGAAMIPDSCVGDGTDAGGAETNTLTTVTTGITTGQIPIGTTAGGVSAYVTLPACAADAKLEYLDGAPDTMICEQISGLVDADVSDTLTASLFVGSGSSTTAIDLATAEVAGLLPAANIVVAPAISGLNIDSFPQTKSKTLFDSTNLTATDDIPDLWRFRQASTVTAAKCISTGGTSITLTIEDDAGNDLTTSCVCAVTLTTCTLTANVTFSADERADWTTVSVSGSVTSATMSLDYDYD